MCEIQWFPALEEYDPGITTEKWLELLTDKSIIGGDYVWARVLAVFYAENENAVPSILNRKYGYNGSLLQYCTYQNYCVDFVKSHPEAMLILSMGLGKSIISLTAILDLMFDSFDVGKVLVIAPLRVAKMVWPEERENWEHASFLRMSVITGTAKQREAAADTSADVYVINRENVKWLADRYEKKKERWPFDMVVIDELSSFKNHQSLRWKALRKVRPYWAFHTIFRKVQHRRG